LYNFSRTINYNPNVLTSDDLGNTWEYRGKLLTIGTGSIRPYVRYASNGDKIHFITTEGHPRDINNSVYHGYVKDGQLFNSGGVLVDPNVFDASGVSPTALTTVFAANTVVDGKAMTRAWTVDVATDTAGDPVAVFQARIDEPGTLSGGQESREHQFFYARYDGEANTWTTHTLAAAGRDIYSSSPNGSEDDYTGLVSIDPNDTSTLYMSSDIDPRNGTRMENYEIFRGHTPDGGETWHWDPITFNSTMKNVRPVIPNWSPDETALVWMRGTYNSYQSFSPEVVALTEITPLDLTGNTELDGNHKFDVAK
jgi:hypothetical protein